MHSDQLLLNVRPRGDVYLDDFQGTSFGQILDALEQLLKKQLSACYLFGQKGVGKHALLAAFIAEVEYKKLSSMHLPLSEIVEMGPEVLDGLESFDVLTLDGLDAIAGRADWEEGIFHLLNRLQSSNTAWVITGSKAISEMGIVLPDLRSRLQQAAAFMLPMPDDRSREQLLLSSADRRGLILDEDVARYVLERGPRYLGEFLNCIEWLDRESLQAKRRLTVPFAREALSRFFDQRRQAA